MVSKEYVVPLIVQSDNSSADEVRFLRKKTFEHPRNCFSYSRAEVVKNYLGIMVR